jgi:hypothetical protein
MHRLLFTLALCSCAGCPPTPQPIPTPVPVVDAAPGGPFDAIIVNCGEVRPQTVAARPAVEVCLATQQPADDCMIDLLSTWGPWPAGMRGAGCRHGLVCAHPH